MFADPLHLFGLLTPALLVVLLVAAAARIAPQEPHYTIAAGTMAAAVGFLAGYFLFVGGPVAPKNSEHWLPYGVLLATAMALLESLAPLSLAVKLGLRLIAAAVISVFLVPTWPTLQPYRIWWIAGVTLAIFAPWSVLEPAARKMPAFVAPAVLTLIAGVSGFLLLWSGSLSFFQIALVLGMLLAGCAVVSVWVREPPPILGIMPTVAVALPGLLASGFLYTFTQLPALSFALFALLAAAPLGLAVALIPIKKPRLRFLPQILGVVLTLAAVGAALTLAQIAEPFDPAEYLSPEEEW
jgi:hypothetical protein